MKFEADFVVVGAGSAGCAVARRLLDETDANVLILEAGGSDAGVDSISDSERWIENIGGPHDWNYGYTPTANVDYRPITLPRGKVLGGSSSINAMYWVRGNREDFDGWAQNGNIGWDFESVLPFFKKSEDWEGGENGYRGIGGPIRVERKKPLGPLAEAVVNAGLSYGMPYLDDVNIPTPVGAGPVNMNVRGGQRCSMAEAYLHPVADHERLMIVTGAQVTRLQISGTRCLGVHFLKDGVEQTVRALQEVVVCAGAIDSPRLLLLSGIGPSDELRRLGIEVALDLPGVGENLQEHPLFTGLCFEARSGFSETTRGTGSAIFWKSRAALSTPDLMFVPVALPFVSPELAGQYAIPAAGFSILPSLVGVHSRGYLRMKTSRHDGPLDIQPNLLADSRDVEAMLAAIEIGFELASEPALRDIIGRWCVPNKRLNREDTKAFLRQGCSAYYHPVGTCAMGLGEFAVVDSRLRVHGIEGLRIADASVMPTIPSGNTNAATVMIGEMTAHMIAQDMSGAARGRKTALAVSAS